MLGFRIYHSCKRGHSGVDIPECHLASLATLNQFKYESGIDGTIESMVICGIYDELY